VYVLGETYVLGPILVKGHRSRPLLASLAERFIPYLRRRSMPRTPQRSSRPCRR